jgi:hypothetical protein
MTKARDISKLLSTANGKIAGANLDVSFENISDSGTAGTKVASGTTGQRGSTAGQIRFNTTTGLAEYYTGTEFKVIDAPPTVTAISPLEVDSTAGGNITFTITGSNFQSGAVVKFIGNDATELTASTTTITNSTTISAVIARSSFVGAKEPYDVRVINTSGLSGTLDNQINVDVSPAWSTASGSLGEVYEDFATSTISTTATDADGDTIVYSVQSGTLPTGLSLNSSTGTIAGTPNVNDTYAGGGVTHSFTLRATANSKTADRAFSILRKWKDGSTQAQALQYGSEVIDIRGGSFTAGKYWLTGLTASALTAQEVYVDTDGFMLFYRHAGTGGSYNATYGIYGNTLGEAAVGTLNSPTQGLTDAGSSTTANSRGVARLSTQFVRALGGESASGNVYRYEVGGVTNFITDTQLWYTVGTGGSDIYDYDNNISAGTSYGGRRSISVTPDTGRPLGSYSAGNPSGLIPFYHADANYSGGYNGSNWDVSTTLWVRQY